jgi:hypothetical protein
MRLFLAGLLILVFAACNYVTYTPRTKKQVRREKPSIMILSRIVDFRIEHNSWPLSKEDFISKGKKYNEAFEGFPYYYTEFKIIDSNRMTFYFSRHIKDLQQHEQTQKVDLNAYGGRVRFYKENGRFVWKLKMY